MTDNELKCLYDNFFPSVSVNHHRSLISSKSTTNKSSTSHQKDPGDQCYVHLKKTTLSPLKLVRVFSDMRQTCSNEQQISFFGSDLVSLVFNSYTYSLKQMCIQGFVVGSKLLVERSVFFYSLQKRVRIFSFFAYC